MRVTRRQFAIATMAVIGTGCGNDQPTAPSSLRTVAQALNSLGLTVECHRTLGPGITSTRDQGHGGYIITINGRTFGETGDGQRIDLLNWPVGPNDQVEAIRVSNTPVVTPGTALRCT